MLIRDAIYQLSDIRKPTEQSRSQRERHRPDSASHAAQESPDLRKAKAPTDSARKPIKSLGMMLQEHFVDEVRRRDHDGDGRLNWREYGGSREEFEHVDADHDGYVAAHDMVREALERSDALRDIVSGRWAPVFDSLVNLSEPDNSDLMDAVRAGANVVYHNESAQRAASKQDMSGMSETALAPEDLAMEFVSGHRDLISLYERLQDLADRLGRYHRYTPIDAHA